MLWSIRLRSVAILMVLFLSYAIEMYNEKLGSANSHFYSSVVCMKHFIHNTHTHTNTPSERSSDQIVFMHVVSIHQNWKTTHQNTSADSRTDGKTSESNRRDKCKRTNVMREQFLLIVAGYIQRNSQVTARPTLSTREPNRKKIWMLHSLLYI